MTAEGRRRILACIPGLGDLEPLLRKIGLTPRREGATRSGA